ncbi:MAG: hypothetical protein DKM50_10665 [Candidatus Margulisiibacteriota bacterium]|nr:MAG: hypothetical protein DKM50_10665 [Candidatus Margulisiibacteriota bacterium]
MTNKGIVYKTAETEEDYKGIYLVRKSIFVDQFHYREDTIVVESSPKDRHFIAIKNEEIIGSITVSTPKDEKLSIENYFDISSFKSNKDIEIKKLAVKNPTKNLLVGPTLIALAYEYIKSLSKHRIFIFAPIVGNLYHVKLWEKFGYKIVGSFNYEQICDAYAMYLDINSFESSTDFIKSREFAKRKYSKIKAPL